MVNAIAAQTGEPAPDPATLPRFAARWPVYLYSPPVTILFMLLAQLPFWWALALWLLSGLSAVALAVRLIWKAYFAPTGGLHSTRAQVLMSLPATTSAGMTGIPYGPLALISLGFCPVLIAATNGQGSGIMLLAYAVAFYLARPEIARRLDWAAGLCAAVVAIWKPQLLIGVGLLWLLTARWRAILWLLGGSAAVHGFTLLVLPPSTYSAWISNLLAFNGSVSSSGLPPSDVTVRSLLQALTPGAGGASDVLYYLYLLGALALFVLFVRRVGRSTLSPGQKHGWLFVLAALASVLMPPYLLIYDLTLLLIPMLVSFPILARHGELVRRGLIFTATLVYVGIYAANLVALLWGVQLAGVVSIVYAAYLLYRLVQDTALEPSALFPSKAAQDM